MNVSLLGPSLLELGEQTNSDLTELVYVFTSRSIGFFAGTLVGGHLIDKYVLWGKTFMFASLATTTLFTFITPLVPYVSILILVCFIQGTALGVIDNIAQVLLIRLMDGNGGKEVQPYMQALHAAFGVGAFISPLIIAPFLGGEASFGDPLSDGEDDSESGSTDNTTVRTASGSTTYHYAYYLIAALIIPIAASMAYYMIRDENPMRSIMSWWRGESWTSVAGGGSPSSDGRGYTDDQLDSPSRSVDPSVEIELGLTRHPSADISVQSVVDDDDEMVLSSSPDEDDEESNGAAGMSASPAVSTDGLVAIDAVPSDATPATGVDWVKWRMVLLIGLFLFLYVGTESGFGAFIFTYGIKQSHMDPSHAALLNAAFWFSFAFGRLLGIPVSLKFSATTMIFSDLLGCILSLLCIIIFHDSTAVLWIGTVTYGISVASVYPSAINYAESQFPMTGQVLSALTVAASSGDAVMPLLMGFSISSAAGPMGLMLLAMAVAVGAATIFAVIVGFVAPKSRRTDASDKKKGGNGTANKRRRKKNTLPNGVDGVTPDSTSTVPASSVVHHSSAGPKPNRSKYNVVLTDLDPDSDSLALERELDDELRRPTTPTGGQTHNNLQSPMRREDIDEDEEELNAALAEL